NDSERLRPQVVGRLAVVDANPELRGLGTQLVVGEILDLGLEGVDELRDRLEVLELAPLTEVRDLVQHQRDQALPRESSVDDPILPEPRDTAANAPGRRSALRCQMPESSAPRRATRLAFSV